MDRRKGPMGHRAASINKDTSVTNMIQTEMVGS